MVTRILTCDRCKRELDKGEALISVAVLYVFGENIYTNSSSNYKAASAQWCRTCCIEMGIISNKPGAEIKVTPIEPKPTLEDFIREIIRDELASAEA